MSTSHVSSSLLPTPYGTFDMHGFVDSEMGKEHLVLSMGVLNDGATVLTRLHSECLTGDALFSLRCDSVLSYKKLSNASLKKAVVWFCTCAKKVAALVY